MKQRSLFLVAGALVLASASSQAFTPVFADNFNSLGSGAQLSSYNGWQQTEANPTPINPLAYGQDFGAVPTSPGAAFGGFYAYPSNPSASIWHTFSTPLANSTTSVSFTISDVAPIDQFPPSNAFSISALSGGNNVFTLMASPSGTPGVWNTYYQAGGNSLTYVGTHAFTQDQITDLTMTFYASDTSILYNVSASAPSSTLGLNGDTGLAPTATYDEFRVTMFANGYNILDPGASYGSNFIAMDNLNVVPEPASMMLAGLGAAASFLRRRRA